MKKIIALAVLAFALAVGTVTVLTINSQPAVACITSACKPLSGDHESRNQVSIVASVARGSDLVGFLSLSDRYIINLERPGLRSKLRQLDNVRNDPPRAVRF